MSTHEYAADDISWFRSVFDGGLTPGGRTVEDFDAALAEHDREVAEKAWNDALWWAAPTDPVARRWQREKPFPPTHMPQCPTPKEN